MAGPTTSGLAALQAGEDWHYVGATDEPAFQNSWANLGGTAADLGFRLRAGGEVNLQGVVTSGTVGAVIFTLPEGYRPNTDVRMGVTGSISTTMSSGLLRVETDGDVYGLRVPANHDTIYISGSFWIVP